MLTVQSVYWIHTATRNNIYTEWGRSHLTMPLCCYATSVKWLLRHPVYYWT